MNPVVNITTSLGHHQGRAVRGQGAGHRHELPELRRREVLRRHHLPSGHPELHDPGRRLQAGHEAEDRPRPPIKNESSNGLSNTRGTIAMARTNEPDSATSQFFINVEDNGFLDKARPSDRVGYCVFGKVIEGMDVVDKIKAVKTGTQGHHGDVPVKDVTSSRFAARTK